MKEISNLRTPYFAIDEDALDRNLNILAQVQEQSGAKILLAQKAFSIYQLYPKIGEVLQGTTASGLFEARLGKEEMGGETHIFSPAYQAEDFPAILRLVDHLSFNSFGQWQTYKKDVLEAGKSAGLRINPRHSTQGGGIYDPCSVQSRLGIVAEDFIGQDLSGIEGLHFHTLCEQNFDALEATLQVVEEQFADLLPRMKWLNLGGGHHITREDYDLTGLIACIQRLIAKYDLTVYLEPGEAVVLNAGILRTKVVDLVQNDLNIAILDASAACHMPDVLEMPYRPPVLGAGRKNEKKYTYQLAGPTCLAGDVIGDYSFDEPLKINDELVFQDMALYTMVKTNTFNGMPLPAIVSGSYKRRKWEVLREFGYIDFKMRL